MVRVYEHAGSDRIVVREKPGDVAVEPTTINAHPQFHFEERHKILNWCAPKPETLAKICCVLFGLQLHITGQNTAFRWIVSHAWNSEKILELGLSFR
jgi:hypothetical protein